MTLEDFGGKILGVVTCAALAVGAAAVRGVKKAAVAAEESAPKVGRVVVEGGEQLLEKAGEEGVKAAGNEALKYIQKQYSESQSGSKPPTVNPYPFGKRNTLSSKGGR